MSKTFFIGDCHFGHRGCLSFDQRPYSSVEEMDLDMVHRWNSRVASQDFVYVLGDFAWANSATRELEMLPTLKRLKGNIILIRGNHDKLKAQEYRDLFYDIKDYGVVDIQGRRLILFHYPILDFDGQHHGNLHLYAHVHNKPLPCSNPGSLCVSACRPYVDYTPRELSELLPYFEGGDPNELG